jgi:O-succinylbenzoic acid--CoA ligase
MIIDSLESDQNLLFLNPRLPKVAAEIFERAWHDLVDSKLKGQVGIATSGSSGDGFGKLIVLSKSALVQSAKAVNSSLRANEHDKWLKALPDFHVGGLGILIRSHFSRTYVSHSKTEKWNAEEFYGELASQNVTLVSLVPTQLFDLIGLNLTAPPELRAVLLGGGRLEEDLYSRAIALGWPVLPSYGLTECASTVASARVPGDPRLYALPHVSLRISDEGLIQVQSPSLLTGQLSFSKTGTATWSDPKQGGWFTTEDHGTLGSDGELKILGRTSDFIKIGGEGVVVSRLENTFERVKLKLRLKTDAAIIAVADERLGAQIVMISEEAASTDVSEDKNQKELVESYNAAVTPFERIRKVYQVDKVPRSALGKLLRSEAHQLIGVQAPPDLR